MVSGVSSLSSGSVSVVVERKNAGMNTTGTSGRPVELMTNYVELKTIPGFLVKQYRVDFDPKEDQTSFKKTMMYALEDKLGPFIFDGSVLYTSRDISDEVRKTSALEVDEMSSSFNIFYLFPSTEFDPAWFIGEGNSS